MISLGEKYGETVNANTKGEQKPKQPVSEKTAKALGKTALDGKK